VKFSGLWGRGRRARAQQRSGAAASAPAKALLRRIQARYDAAATTDASRRHWANADGLSADAAASPAVRRVLRNRARYECANNSYARGMISTLAGDVVGTGPRLQMLTDNSAANRDVERRWDRWAASIDLAAKLRTMRAARAESGECFGLLAVNPRRLSPSPVQLDLRLIEADQVATPTPHLRTDPRVIDGIVYDGAGNPVEYHLLRNHPGDVRLSSMPLDYRRIPARQVVHYFRADRPGQSRGIPEITPALPLFAQVRRYTLAVIAAAETAADLAGVLYTDAPPDDEAATAIEPMDAIEIEQRMLLTMPGGWKMAQLKAEQPATTYAEFQKQILNEIARCLNMPFNVAAGNSSGYNYASGRLDHQTYDRAIRIDQAELQQQVLDRLLDAWLDEAVLVTGFLPQSMRRADANRAHTWIWAGRDHVDPAKEASAQTARLSNRTTSLAREYARQGLDWETELLQIAREREYMRSIGLTIDDDPELHRG